MKPFVVIFGVMALAVTCYFLIHLWITGPARGVASSDSPELAWLRREFSLSQEQFEMTRRLHLAHGGRSLEIRNSLQGARARLRKAVDGESWESEDFASALNDWRLEMERSQDPILRHVLEVGEVMDDDQARRYRERIFGNLIFPGRRATSPHSHPGTP